MSNLLKLRARDAEDVEVISAVLQDSIVPLCDMAFQVESKTFIIVAQRLKRDAGKDAERICSALTIAGVKSVQTNGIDQNDTGRMLDLLALMLDASMSSLTFMFAGNAQIRLELGEWGAAVEDFGESWPALCAPCHESTV